MKKIIIFLLTLLFINCSPTGKVVTHNNDKMLLGKSTKNDLKMAPFNSWYNAGFTAYEPNEEIVNLLKDKVTNITVTIFMGTWCEDSNQQVPHFYKVLEASQFKKRGVTLIAMDLDKTTPENLEAGLHITNTPTFIFYEKGVEINRIVEAPKVSLEQDMLDILSDKNYKPNYSDLNKP